MEILAFGIKEAQMKEESIVNCGNHNYSESPGCGCDYDYYIDDGGCGCDD